MEDQFESGKVRIFGRVRRTQTFENRVPLNIGNPNFEEGALAYCDTAPDKKAFKFWFKRTKINSCYRNVEVLEDSFPLTTLEKRKDIRVSFFLIAKYRGILSKKFDNIRTLVHKSKPGPIVSIFRSCPSAEVGIFPICPKNTTGFQIKPAQQIFGTAH